MILQSEVRELRQWSARSFSLFSTRPPALSFRPGHYLRLSLPGDEAESVPWRAYSIVSAPAEPWLEFFLTLIPDGALSPRLAALRPGDGLLLSLPPLGFFLADSLAEGEVLWLLATGSGIGPYISMLREGSLWQRFARVVLVCSVREAADLAYDEECRTLAARLPAFDYVPVVTREARPGVLSQRIPDLLTAGVLAQPALDARRDRVMVCGNPAFSAEMRTLLGNHGFTPCRGGQPGTMLFENYWKDRR